MNNSYCQKLSIVFFAVISLIGCGKGATAKKQISGKVTPPEYYKDKNSVLSLSEGFGRSSYTGTVLVIDEAANRERLGDVLNASAAARNAWAELYRFEKQSRYVELYDKGGVYDKMAALWDDKIKNYQNVAREKNLASSQKEFIAGWFVGKIDQVYANDSEKKTKARQAFSLYCEAKIWELATNSYFATRQYASVPSPLGFCAGYYKSAALLNENVEECAPSPSKDFGKNYFRCLWQEGVLKTRWLNEEKPNFKNNSKAVKLKNSLTAIFSDKKNTELFRRLMALEDDPAIFASMSDRIKLIVIGKKDAPTRYIANNLTLGKTVSCKNLSADVASFYSELCTGLIAYPSVRSNLDMLAPGELINLFEQPDSSMYRNLFIFDSLKLSETQELKLELILEYFAKRGDNHQNSNSDFFLHRLAGGARLPKAEITNEKLRETANLIESQLKDAYGALTPEDEAVISEWQKVKQSYLSDQNAMREKYGVWYQATTKATDTGMRAANVKGVAKAFYESKIDIINRNGILALSINFSGLDRGLRGCYDKAAQKFIPWGETGCGETDFADSILKITPYSLENLTQDRDSDIVYFDFSLSDADLYGLGKKERNESQPDYFSDLSSSDLSGLKMKFELYPGRLAQSYEYKGLEIFTGKVQIIKQNGEVLYEGGISYWRQD
ncbi:MAG: hypothetical protein HQK54_01980 [Oligoflexales bacterium]|nr:hypothetical protein [Oligoflexales bacterium]